jgi:hypothetical protein
MICLENGHYEVVKKLPKLPKLAPIDGFAPIFIVARDGDNYMLVGLPIEL